MLRYVLLSLLISCSHQSEVTTATQDREKLEKHLASLAGSYSTSVEFEKEATKLTTQSKEHLNQLAAQAQQDGREIEKIKILAWADQEYPDPAQKKAHPKQIILAKERAESIKDYLEDGLRAQAEIDSFNMAKRPDLLSQLVKGDEYEVKHAVEEVGPTGTRLEDGSVSYSKASRAVVIVDYKDK